MGAADLVAAFNSVAQPAYTCTKATLGYERSHDVEWQVLTISGIGADGSAITLTEKLRPGADPVLAARDVAQKLIAPKEPAT